MGADVSLFRASFMMKRSPDFRTECTRSLAIADHPNEKQPQRNDFVPHMVFFCCLSSFSQNAPSDTQHIPVLFPTDFISSNGFSKVFAQIFHWILIYPPYVKVYANLALLAVFVTWLLRAVGEAGFFGLYILANPTRNPENTWTSPPLGLINLLFEHSTFSVLDRKFCIGMSSDVAGCMS